MKKAVVVGGGPAGLMAAEVLSGAGVEVHVYELQMCKCKLSDDRYPPKAGNAFDQTNHLNVHV